MSTMPGKHGSIKSKTEVPRLSLVDELDSKTQLHNTNTMPHGALFQEIRV